jgi:hypothetical protein
MAVIKNADYTRLMVKVNTGLDSNGKAIVKTRTFGNVQAAASNQDFYDVAVALGGLQSHPVEAILREDNGQLINEA